MKRVYFISFIVSQLLFFGCTNQPVEKFASSTVVSRNEATTTFLFRGHSKYADMLRFDAPVIGYFSEKPNPLSNEYLSVFDLGRAVTESNARTLSAESATANELSININGTDIRDIRNQQSTPNVRSVRAGGSPLFGNTVTFSLFRGNSEDENEANNMLRSGSSDTDREVTMYVPELVQILSPRVETEEDFMPFCYYRNFILKWNADPQNENGLVVAVEWSGTDIFGKDYGRHIMNVDIINNDNGQAILDNRLFEGIPQGAVARLMLLRGNIEVIEDFLNEHGQEEAFRIVAISQATLSFIMVREITIIDG